MTHNRRSFLKAAGITTAAVSAAPLALGFPSGDDVGPGVALAAPGRGYSAGHFALELDGKTTILVSTEGGLPYGDVVTAYSGAEPFPRKHIGNVKYEDISMMVPVDVGKPVRDWIKSMLSGAPQRKSGSIIYADFDYQVRRRLDFTDALISEVTIPALDGGSKEAAYLKIVVTPSATSYSPASGDLKGKIGGKQKTWLTSNFRINIGGLETKRVSKVDAFTIKQGIAESQDGDQRIRQIEPTKLEFPDLKVTFSEADLPTWQTWFDDFVLAGKNSDGDEKAGTIELLTPDLKTALATIQVHHLGIFKLVPAVNDEVARWEASLYMEGAAIDPFDK